MATAQKINITPEFHHVVQEEYLKPFQYGTNDCALMVANVYKRLIGIDFAEGIRGTYTDEYHAARTIVKLGGWEGILSERNFVKITNHKIRRGDIVICEGALGIWTGDKALFAGRAYRKLSELDSIYRYTGEPI